MIVGAARWRWIDIAYHIYKIAAIVMATGEAGGTKKRKASAAEDVTSSPARREPRRGLGVAELERIRVALEVAERCYAAAASSLSSTPHQPALPPAAQMVVHAAGVAAAPPAAHHQHAGIGNGAVHHQHQLQMTRGYLTPYYLTQHYYGNDSFTRLFTNGGHPSSHQNHHHSSHQNHCPQADQIQSAVTALPVTGQAVSFESSSSASQRRQGHRIAHVKPGQTTAPTPPQVAFVDLVDSDDHNGGDVEELDLELKL